MPTAMTSKSSSERRNRRKVSSAGFERALGVAARQRADHRLCELAILRPSSQVTVVVRMFMSKDRRRQCVFCGRPGVTREHVIPRWVLAELAPAGIGAPYRHTSGSDMRSTHWLSPGIDFTVKRVCKSCNSGWMNSDIEVPARRWIGSMLMARSSILSADARRDIAAWTYKTTAMALFRTAGPSYSTAAHLSYLHQTHQAPEEAAVFLGHYGQPTEILIDGFCQRFDLAPAPQAESENAQGVLAGEIFKLRMGPLLIMCLVGSAGRTFVKGAAFQEGFDDRLISIWPQRSIRDPSWPPPKSVRSDDEWKSLTLHFLQTH